MAMQDSEQFVGFLHSLSDMGAAMRTVITKVISNAEMYTDFNQGELDARLFRFLMELQ